RAPRSRRRCHRAVSPYPAAEDPPRTAAGGARRTHPRRAPDTPLAIEWALRAAGDAVTVDAAPVPDPAAPGGAARSAAASGAGAATDGGTPDAGRDAAGDEPPEPGWPSANGRRVVILLDAAGAYEARV